MSARLPVLLASTSPRRQSLLREAGVDVLVQLPAIDDGQLRCGEVTVEQWVMALAYLKARSVLDIAGNAGSRIVLGADTVCVHEGRVLGQPRDAEHARWMLRGLRSAEHATVSGVCLLTPHRRLLFFDRAIVQIGELSDEAIDQYVASGHWSGKAGGYNLAEQIDAGWPIRCVGDPATVMGLPMRRLEPLLVRPLL